VADAFSGLAGPPTWSFGDGASASGAGVSHPYAAAGSYQVTLVARDAAGNETSATRQITVRPGAAAIPPPPGAGAVPTARAGCATRPTVRGTRLSCGVVLGPGAPASRVALRLVRGGRVRALADVTAGGRVLLRSRDGRRLTAGPSTLVALVVVADGRARQTRRGVTIR
jgi:PKD domain-containing protein